MKIPIPKLVDITKLKVDGENPNVMSKKKRTALGKIMKTFGFIVPVITNKDLVIADGEQRWTVAKDDLKMKQISVIRLDVKDVDRRMLRQVLNKLKGEHNIEADAKEFKKILAKYDMEEFSDLIATSEQEILNILNSVAEKPPSDVDEVKQLYKQEVTCPKCGTKFQKGD